MHLHGTTAIIQVTCTRENANSYQQTFNPRRGLLTRCSILFKGSMYIVCCAVVAGWRENRLFTPAADVCELPWGMSEVAMAAPVRSSAHSWGVAMVLGPAAGLVLLEDRGMRKRSKCMATARRCLSNVERRM